MREERYLIWSYEHGGWWGPRRMGYVRELSAAGRYAGVEAREIVLGANRYGAERKEAMVAEEDGVKFLAARDKDAEIERLKDERNEWQATILSFRSLLTRAADALENLEVGSFVHGRPLGLIAELRKAAQ